jgi:hypothetical protein
MSRSNTSRSQTIDAPHLSASAVRRLPKPRTGFVQFSQEVAAVIKARPDAVNVKGYDPDAILALLVRVVAMASDTSDKKSAYVTAAEAQMVLSSTIWQLTLLGYQHLKTAARTDGRLQTAIEPLEAFMKQRNGRKKRKTTPSTPSTPVAA